MSSDFVADDGAPADDAIDIREQRRRAEVDEPSSPVARFDEPLQLDAGPALSPWQIAYQVYGELNADRTNAVLVCHALTGDQHAANRHPVTGRLSPAIRRNRLDLPVPLTPRIQVNDPAPNVADSPSNTMVPP